MFVGLYCNLGHMQVFDYLWLVVGDPSMEALYWAGAYDVN